MKNLRRGSCPRRNNLTDLTHDPATSSAFVSCLSESLFSLSDSFNANFSVVMVFGYFVIYLRRKNPMLASGMKAA